MRISIGAIAAIGLTIFAILTKPDVRRGPPAWSDEFDRAPDAWSLHDGAIIDGALVLQPSRPDSAALAARDLPAADFAAETQARVLAGSTDNAYGLVVGNEVLTAFLISGDGYCSVARRINGRWRDVQPWRPWPHVRRGQAFNTLRLECASHTCAFYVNEEITARAEIGGERRRIGLMAWRYTADELQLGFEHMSVWAASLPQPTSESPARTLRNTP